MTQPSRRTILRATCAAALLGCGPSSRPPATHVPVVVLQGDDAAIRSAERAYLAAGLPPVTRQVRVRVLSEPGITPAILPAGTASPGALGGTWPSGDVDVAEPQHLPHELLHAALLVSGQDPDREHRGALWARVPR